MLRLAEEQYVAELLLAEPQHLPHRSTPTSGPRQRGGPGTPAWFLPGHADAAQLAARIDAGEWVVDLRSRRAFAAGHLSGSLSFEHGGDFTNYLGWLIPWGSPLTLLGDTPEQVAEAQRDLARIGIDQLAGAATGTPQDWAGGQPLAYFQVASFAELAAVRHHRPVIVLDVRRALEWAGGHLDGALHIPLQDLPARIGEVPSARSGCTAGPATGPLSPHPCSRRPGTLWSPWTTSSPTPATRACR